MLTTGQTVMILLIIGISAFFYFSTQSAKKQRIARTERRAQLAATRALTLEAFARDEPPPVSAPNIVLTKGERVIWSEPARLYEERVVSRKWEGGSKGISIPTGVLGTRISLGKTQGRLNVERQTVPIATGALVITSRNLLFHGDTKSSKAALDKIITVNCAADGIIIAVTGRAKPWTVVFNDPEAGEVVRVALEAAYRQPA